MDARSSGTQAAADKDELAGATEPANSGEPAAGGRLVILLKNRDQTGKGEEGSVLRLVICRS
jgi:hypothetical protein